MTSCCSEDYIGGLIDLSRPDGGTFSIKHGSWVEYNAPPMLRAGMSSCGVVCALIGSVLYITNVTSVLRTSAIMSHHGNCAVQHFITCTTHTHFY
jgi:hypothetical protein